MAASYPGSVRQFEPKQDTTMYILAAHVNDLQDEVSAIERVVGALPAEWDNGATTVKVYQNVKSRLDDAQNTITIVQSQIASMQTQLSQIGPIATRVTNLENSVASIRNQISSINSLLATLASSIVSDEARLTNLENNTGGVSGSLASIQNQINALQQGAAASILCTGQAISPDPYQWNTIVWNSVEYDNVGIFSGGSSLVCPQDGWWMINFFGIFPNTRSGANGTQCQANMQLLINSNGVVSDRKEIELGIGGSLGFNCAFAGPWYRGSVATGQVNFNPYNSSAPSFSGRISFTRMHSL